MSRRGGRRSWKGFTVDDFRRYYEDHYQGLSSSDVKKADSGFYDTVWKRGFTKQVFPPNKRCKYDRWDLQDFKDFMEIHLRGFSPGDVQKINIGFYKAVYRRGLIEEVFNERKYNDWQSMSDEELKDYYEEHLNGLSRKEVDGQDNKFYHAILRRGLVEEIIPKKRYDWLNWTTEDFQRHYGKNFQGMSGNEVEKDKNGGSQFYQAVKKRKILRLVFPQKKKPNGYYQDLENVGAELEKVIAELGKFPISSELRRINSSLDSYIRSLHGGIDAVRVKLGYLDQELELLKQIVEEADG